MGKQADAYRTRKALMRQYEKLGWESRLGRRKRKLAWVADNAWWLVGLSWSPEEQAVMRARAAEHAAASP